jgi:hypothetical protein
MPLPLTDAAAELRADPGGSRSAMSVTSSVPRIPAPRDRAESVGRSAPPAPAPAAAPPGLEDSPSPLREPPAEAAAADMFSSSIRARSSACTDGGMAAAFADRTWGVLLFVYSNRVMSSEFCVN